MNNVTVVLAVLLLASLAFNVAQYVHPAREVHTFEMDLCPKGR